MRFVPLLLILLISCSPLKKYPLKSDRWENDIKFLESDTNFFLIKTSDTRDIVQDQLEKRGLILYSSYDGHDNYWTLPLGDEETNSILLDTILYKNL